MRKSVGGFTIVELLIVVVVIAILAAITIVAYNGISERARVSAASSFAAQIKHRDLVDAQGFWNFDECSGGVAANSAGKAPSPTNTINGTVTWSSDTPLGTGCSLAFNGSSTNILTEIPLSNEYYRKSAWIKTSSTGGQNLISTSVSNESGVLYFASGTMRAGHNGSWNAVTVPFSADGKWHHVAVEYTRNGTSSTGTLELIIDGSTVSTNSSVPVMTDPTPVQYIGAYGTSAGNAMNGLMDDVMIITR